MSIVIKLVAVLLFVLVISILEVIITDILGVTVSGPRIGKIVYGVLVMLEGGALCYIAWKWFVSS